MHLRRTLVLAAGTLLLTAPTLSSCGFDYATDRINTIGAGVNDRSGSVDVLGAVIVASGPGSGTFTASFSNNDDEADSFASLQPGGDVELTVEPFEPVEIPARGAVNLAEAGGVRVSGEFGAGDFISVIVGFEGGEQVAVEIPVVTACYQYDGLDNAPEPATGAAETGEAYSCEPAEEPEH